MSGRLVRTPVDQWQSAGAHRVDVSASELPSGTHFYRLETGFGTAQGKMLLIRWNGNLHWRTEPGLPTASDGQ